jgi:hypothetical protein
VTEQPRVELRYARLATVIHRLRSDGRLVVLNGRLDGVKEAPACPGRGSVVETARAPMRLLAGRLDIDAYFAGEESAVAGLCAALEGS